MKGFFRWFRSSAKMKRWMLLIIIGIVLACYGMAEILTGKRLDFWPLVRIIVCFVVGFIAFIKYTIGNIVKLIVGAVKRKKHSKKINKDNKKEIAKQTIKQGKPVVNVDSEEVRKVVIPKTREFLHKYRKEGNIKQVIKNHTKEYRELLIKETQQFHNSKEIVEHYINQYSK